MLILTVQRFLSELPVTVPVIPAHAWLEDGLYWRRRARASHPATDVAKHGNSWKRLCVEQTVRAVLAAGTESSAGPGTHGGFPAPALRLLRYEGGGKPSFSRYFVTVL